MPLTLTVQDVANVLEEIAPLRYAETWDNVGLLVGSQSAEVRTALLTIDFTEELIPEVAELGAELVISYHPVLFQPTQRITSADPGGRLLLGALRQGIAVYSPHTALDAAEGGTADWLADAVGRGYRRPLYPHAETPSSQEVKLVTFVPPNSVDRVRDALASAGAGRIGAYQACSFATPGTGTFLGGEGTNPAVGQAGRLEHVDEVRLEMVCPKSALALLITALKHFHPYEEPAYDLYPLHATPSNRIGAGRKIVLDQEATVGTIAEQLKEHLGLPLVRATDRGKKVKQIGLVPGSGSDLLFQAIEQGCDLFVTGEMSYHRVLYAEMAGCSVILTGHTESERGYLPVLEEQIRRRLPGLKMVISGRDRTRFQVI